MAGTADRHGPTQGTRALLHTDTQSHTQYIPHIQLTVPLSLFSPNQLTITLSYLKTYLLSTFFQLLNYRVARSVRSQQLQWDRSPPSQRSLQPTSGSPRGRGRREQARVSPSGVKIPSTARCVHLPIYIIFCSYISSTFYFSVDDKGSFYQYLLDGKTSTYEKRLQLRNGEASWRSHKVRRDHAKKRRHAPRFHHAQLAFSTNHALFAFPPSKLRRLREGQGFEQFYSGLRHASSEEQTYYGQNTIFCHHNFEVKLPTTFASSAYYIAPVEHGHFTKVTVSRNRKYTGRCGIVPQVLSPIWTLERSNFFQLLFSEASNEGSNYRYRTAYGKIHNFSSILQRVHKQYAKTPNNGFLMIFLLPILIRFTLSGCSPFRGVRKKWELLLAFSYRYCFPMNYFTTLLLIYVYSLFTSSHVAFWSLQGGITNVRSLESTQAGIQTSQDGVATEHKQLGRPIRLYHFRSNSRPRQPMTHPIYRTGTIFTMEVPNSKQSCSFYLFFMSMSQPRMEGDKPPGGNVDDWTPSNTTRTCAA